MKFTIKILIFLELLYATVTHSQSFDDKKATIKKVFDNIVTAYGNAKSPPYLEFIARNKSEGNPASYLSEPVPTIKIEEQVFDICKKMGHDSLNALAIILSHELAHYYNDHTWCSDYAYANRNTTLATKLVSQNKGDKIKYETQADNSSFYYCCIAGYSPFDIYEGLIDKIYSTYNLPNAMAGYPNKDERKMICKQAEVKIKQLYPIYDAGILLLHLNQLSSAEACFDYLAKYFPSREIYNNLGVAKLLTGISKKPYELVNFIYPIDIDPVSRIYQNGERSDEENKDYIIALMDAKKQFEKAKSLDPSYLNSYINLACVNDALGNYHAALGYINEGKLVALNDQIKLKHIEAIVQYHLGNKDIAESLLESLTKKESTATFNYHLMKLASTTNENVILEKFKNSFTDSLINITSKMTNCDTLSESILKGENSFIKLNDLLSITAAITSNYSQIKIDISGKIIEARVTNSFNSAQVMNFTSIDFIDPNNGCLIFKDQFTKTINYRVK